jgi:hypothetical protein
VVAVGPCTSRQVAFETSFPSAGKQCSIGFQPVSELNLAIPVEPWTGLRFFVPSGAKQIPEFTLSFGFIMSHRPCSIGDHVNQCGAHVVVALCSPVRVFVFLKEDRMLVPSEGSEQQGSRMRPHMHAVAQPSDCARSLLENDMGPHGP